MKIKYLLLSLVSGVLLSLSHPNFFMQTTDFYTGFLMWTAFIPLFFILVKEKSSKRIFLYGLAAGIFFYMQGLYWLLYVEEMGGGRWPAWIILSFYCSLFLAGPLAAALKLREKFNVSILLSVPVLLTLAEYIREWFLSGFPLLTPAQSQFKYIFLLPVLKFTGVSGLNYLIYFINLAFALYISRQNINLRKNENIFAYVAAGILVLFMAAGNISPGRCPESLKAAVLQPNIDQNTPWNEAYRANTKKVFRNLVESVKDKNPGLYIWPETGYPAALNLYPDGAKEAASWSGGQEAYHLIGADKLIYENGRPKAYNSAFMVSPSGDITGDYGKTHLVPFGEYIPMQDKLPFLDQVVKRAGYNGWTPAEKTEPLDFDGKKAGVLICYEMLFPEISRELVNKGADLLVNMSYEIWYGQSPASAQLFANTVMRAAENDVPLIRCVAGGISGFITRRGKIESTLGLFERGALTGEVKTCCKRPRTLYTVLGEWFVWVLAVTGAVFVAFRVKKRKPESGEGK